MLRGDGRPSAILSRRGQAQHCPGLRAIMRSIALIASYWIAGANSACNDYSALSAFYVATGGSNWVSNTNWMDETSSECSDWYGITGDAAVLAIELRANDLEGSLPTEIGELRPWHLDSIRCLPSCIAH